MFAGLTVVLHPDGGTAVVADTASDFMSASLRLVELGIGAVRTLDSDGAPATLPSQSHVAIDGNGDIVVANGDGLHLLANTGLASDWFPWSCAYKWSPTQLCHHRDSTPATRAAVHAPCCCWRAAQTRLADAGATRQPGNGGLCTLPVLPADLWICAC